MAMSKEIGGGALRGVGGIASGGKAGRTSGGITGAGGKNVNPVYKESGPSKGWEKEIIKEAKKIDKARRRDTNKIQIIK